MRLAKLAGSVPTRLKNFRDSELPIQQHTTARTHAHAHTNISVRSVAHPHPDKPLLRIQHTATEAASSNRVDKR